MTSLVASELVKLNTTRARFAYAVVLLALVALATATMVGGTPAAERVDPEFQHDIVAGAGIVGLIVLILGIVVVTGEFRHGTITPTLLVTPRRPLVVAAKAAAMVLVSVALALVALALVYAIAWPWLSARGEEVRLADGDALLIAAQVVLAAVVWGLLGVAVGAIVQNQVAALVGSLIWLLMAEPLIPALLDLIGIEGTQPYFPGQALDAVAGVDSPDLLSFEGGLALALGYVAAIALLGVLRLQRRDVT